MGAQRGSGPSRKPGDQEKAIMHPRIMAERNAIALTETEEAANRIAYSLGLEQMVIHPLRQGGDRDLHLLHTREGIRDFLVQIAQHLSSEETAAAAKTRRTSRRKEARSA